MSYSYYMKSTSHPASTSSNASGFRVNCGDNFPSLQGLIAGYLPIVEERVEDYSLLINVAGFAKCDIDIFATQYVITINCKRITQDAPKTLYKRMEFVAEIEPKQIKAKIIKDKLSIVVPKKVPGVKVNISVD